MRIKIGPGPGNSGGVVRIGSKLDSGVWVRGWKFRSLWFRWKLRKGLADFGFILFRW